MPATAPVTEIGYAAEASNSYNWWAYDGETTPELMFPQSVQVYDAMRKQDAQVKSVLQAVTQPVRRTPWRVDPAGARPEVVEWVADDLGLPIVGQNPKPPLRTRDRFSWADHLREALLMLPFGFSYFEQTYTVVDGGDRAHLHKLGPRPPRTIERVDVARDGGLVSITQYGTLDQRGPQKPIPVNRLVAYVNEREGGNWLGHSILRSCYKNWLIKDRLLRVQAQTIERNGMGIPLYTGQDGASEADLAKGLSMATSWRSGEAAGSAVPFGATLVLRGVEGDLPDADPAIRYHDEQIARAVLAHFLNLGTQTGSWALGTTFADFFTLSLQTLAQAVADTATMHIVEDLVDVNWGEEEPAPRITFDEIGSRQAATAQAIKTLVDAGIIEPDEVLEQSSRQQYGLPPKDPDTTRGGGEGGGADLSGVFEGLPAEFGEGSVAASGAGPKDWDDAEDDIQAVADGVFEAIAHFLGDAAEVQAAADIDWNAALHPRDRKGRFRTTFARMIDALQKWAARGHTGDPFEGIDREPLRRVARDRGITLRRGASREDISRALVEDLRREHGGEAKPDADKPPAKRAPAKKATPKPSGALSDDPAVREVQVENRIREAYVKVKRPGADWVGLADIREELGESLNRREVDDALRRLNLQDGVNIVPESNQKTLTQADRDSAVEIGNQERHFITIDDPLPRPLPKATPRKRIPAAGRDRGQAPDLVTLRDLPDAEAVRDELDLRKVDDLKALLREQGLPVSGRKRDLVDRLVGHIKPTSTSTGPAEVENRIRDAVRKLAGKSGPLRSTGYVPLADLRDELGDIPRAEQDAALKRLIGQPGVTIVPIVSGQDEMTPRQAEAAIRLGGEEKHYISIEDPEELARERQKDIDKARAVADALTEVDELLHNQASDRALRHRLDRAGIPDDLRTELLAVLGEDRAELHDRLGFTDRQREIDRRIRAAFKRLQGRTDLPEGPLSNAGVSVHKAMRKGGYVAFADLREELDDLPRAEVDDVLRKLSIGDQSVYTTEMTYNWSLLPRDREAALRLGGSDDHFIKIEPHGLGAAPDRDRLRTVAEESAKDAGLTPIGAAGDVDRFNRKLHKPVSGDIADGHPVRVVRRGYRYDRDGEDIQLHKAVVHEISLEEEAALKRTPTAPKPGRPDYLDDENSLVLDKFATSIGVDLARFRDPKRDEMVPIAAPIEQQFPFGYSIDQVADGFINATMTKDQAIAEIRRIADWARRTKAAGRPTHAFDKRSLAAFEQAGGVAEVMDRLAEALEGVTLPKRRRRPSIGEVIHGGPTVDVDESRFKAYRATGDGGLIRHRGRVVPADFRHETGGVGLFGRGGERPQRPGLTRAENDAVDLMIVGTVADALNGSLRQGRTDHGTLDLRSISDEIGDLDLNEQFRDLLSAIQHGRLANDATLFRGALMRPADIRKLVPGAVYTEPGFLHASTSVGIAHRIIGWRQRQQGNRARKPVIFRILAPKGTRAALGHEMADEAMLGPGRRMRVVRVEPPIGRFGKYTIVLELLSELDDVEEIVFTLEPTDAVKKALADRGVKWRVGEE